MNILLVCTGNTCRSPLAEVLLRRELERAGVPDVEVRSAGTGAFDGEQVSEGSYLVALEHGLDLGGHRAQAATRTLVQAQDLIFTMASSHLRKIDALGGGARAHLFGKYAGMPAADAEVADPVGGPIEGYRAVYQQLERMAIAAAQRIARERK